MEMEDQYGMADLRQLMNGRPHFPSIPTPPPPTAELFSAHHRNLSAPPPPPQPQHYEMLMMGSRTPSLHHHHHHHEHQFSSSDYATATAVTGTSTAALSGGGLEVDLGCLGGDGGTGRWPRQETLTLLEIRSRLDPKFKEANQKGPLWDEVSRIMSEEHGYQRSGKKCREKFENLYKYYKKTKEGKAGRQDGKHYRFFRQLEALYGSASTETAAATTAATPQYIHAMSTAVAVETNNQDAFQASLSLSASSEFDSSSSDGYNNDDSTAAEAAEKGKKRRSSGSGGGGGGRRSWKAKVSEFIDAQMRRLMEKQEAWLEKMLRTLEDKEQERMLRDDDWRRQEVARLDREHRFWANERAWIKARDAALLEALQKLAGGCKPQSSPPEELMVAAPEIQNDAEAQTENGNENGGSGGGDGWGERENYSMRSGCYFPMSLGDGSSVHRPNDRSSPPPPPPNSNNGVVVQDGCFRFLMADGGENVWENYGLKLKGENN